jgi:hypothetical protein
MFRKVSWKTRKSRKESVISRRRSHLVLQKMTKVWYKGRICVPNVKELKDKILHEAHESAYSIHPGGNKMYNDHKTTYWWNRMKRDVAEYITLLSILPFCEIA